MKFSFGHCCWLLQRLGFLIIARICFFFGGGGVDKCGCIVGGLVGGSVAKKLEFVDFRPILN